MAITVPEPSFLDENEMSPSNKKENVLVILENVMENAAFALLDQMLHFFKIFSKACNSKASKCTCVE